MPSEFPSRPDNQGTELSKSLEKLQNDYDTIRSIIKEFQNHPHLQRLVQYGEFQTYRFVLELLENPNTALISTLEAYSFPKNIVEEIISRADNVQKFFEANKDYQQFCINRKRFDSRVSSIMPHLKKEGSRSCFHDFFGIIERELDNAYLEIGDELINQSIFHEFNFTERIQLILKNLKDSNKLFEKRLAELRNYPESAKINKILGIKSNN